MQMTIMIRRTAAVGAALSGLLHLVMLGHGHHLGFALSMALLAIICLPCAGHLWRVASVRSWLTIAAMNAAMLGMHLWLLARSDLGHVDPVHQTPGVGTSLGAGHSHGIGESPVSSDGAVGLVGHEAGTAAAAGPGAEVLHEVLLPLASGVAALEILLALLGIALLRRGRRVRQAVHAHRTTPHSGPHPTSNVQSVQVFPPPRLETAVESHDR